MAISTILISIQHSTARLLQSKNSKTFFLFLMNLKEVEVCKYIQAVKTRAQKETEACKGSFVVKGLKGALPLPLQILKTQEK